MPFFSLLLPPQIFVISQAEPRLPLQLDDAVRPDGDGEEVSEDECGDGWMQGGRKGGREADGALSAWYAMYC